MELRFSEKSEERIKRLIARYPNREAALIPVLYAAQDQFGYLSHEVMALVAKRLELPETHVINAATFYTLLRKKETGRYHIQVCTNVSCYLRGSDELLAAIEKKLSILPGKITPDRKFSLEEVQCLAACGNAPALQINDRYYEDMTPAKVVEVIEKLKNE